MTRLDLNCKTNLCVVSLIVFVAMNISLSSCSGGSSKLPQETNDSQSSLNVTSNNDWVIGKWQVPSNEFGLLTLIVNTDNTIVYYGSNTPHFRGSYVIENDVMYCFFPTENIKFPLDKKNQIIDMGEGLLAKKVLN